MTVTIAIPFYNDEEYLELAIKSVLLQTYSNWKLLLINDGSSDSSLDIANKYAQDDNRITVISDGLNKGLAARLNQITSLSKTKYLARMDADDIMHPERIEKQLKILEKNPMIDVLGTNAYSINETNVIQGVRFSYNSSEFQLLEVKGFIHPTIIAKTKWHKDNPYDINVIRGQDFELWERTVKKSVFMLYTEPLLYYREIGYEYYKKYFSAIRSKIYVSIKHKNLKLFGLTVLYSSKALIYYIYHIFGQETRLINRRNYKICKREYKHANSYLSEIIDSF